MASTARPPLAMSGSYSARDPQGGAHKVVALADDGPSRVPLTARPTVTAPRPKPPAKSRSAAGSPRSFLTDMRGMQSSKLDKVEHCVFPGVDECDALPGDVPAPEMMREGVRLVNFASRNHEIRFTRYWNSPICEDMLIAFVWHEVCQHFKPDAEAQDELFSRLATSYAMLFGTTVPTTEAKDAVSWYLPEALAHSACLALLAAFPKSKGTLDASFRRKLFCTFVKWSSGFAGQRSLDGDAAVAARAERAGSNGLSAGGGSGMPTTGSHGNGSHGGGGGGGSGRNGVPRIKLAKLLEERERAGAGSPMSAEMHRVEPLSLQQPRDPSCLARPLPAARRQPKNLTGCSPLMARWVELQHRHGEARGGTMAKAPNRVRISNADARWEEESRLAACGAQTYRDIRREAAKRCEVRLGAYHKSGAKVQKELAEARLAADEEKAALQLERKAVLAVPKEAHEFANYLVSLRCMEDDEHGLLKLATG